MYSCVILPVLKLLIYMIRDVIVCVFYLIIYPKIFEIIDRLLYSLIGNNNNNNKCILIFLILLLASDHSIDILSFFSLDIEFFEKMEIFEEQFIYIYDLKACIKYYNFELHFRLRFILLSSYLDSRIIILR